MALEAHLAAMGRLVLGYSGGVDSTLLGVAALQAVGPSRLLAVTGRSASLPREQWQQARAVARRFGIPLHSIETQELDDPRYRANPTDRCYFCKKELWARLGAVRHRHGFDVVLDGTNADDLHDHRPGFRAAGEAAVRAPLAELGWTKADVREAARALGLPTWSTPASPCLASRVRYGLPVTRERLHQIARGESFLRGLGVEGDLRVRHHGAYARVEVNPGQFSTLDAHWDDVETEFAALGFEYVERDPEGYRRGSLLVLDPEISR